MPDFLNKPILDLKKMIDFTKLHTKNCTIFDIPSEFWAGFNGFSVENDSKVISFEEYAKNKSNYEFLKDFS